MSKHGTIKRWALIIEKTGRGNYPSFREIHNYLEEHGFTISERTLQRDIEKIRYEFSVEIVYDYTYGGYTIDRELSINSDYIERFLEMAITADLFADNLRDGRENHEYLEFESRGDMRGIELLKPLLFAIKNQRKVSFMYRKYQTGNQQLRHVNPRLLKEYLGRWYLVGISARAKAFRIFGLDRMSEVRVHQETFNRKPGNDPRALFQDNIGITYTPEKAQRVVLSFTPLQGKYIKSLPLHSSQEILEDTKKELRVGLRIVPNFEFRQKILMMSPAVKVLQPDSLADDIKASLRLALDQYE